MTVTTTRTEIVSYLLIETSLLKDERVTSAAGTSHNDARETARDLTSFTRNLSVATTYRRKDVDAAYSVCKQLSIISHQPAVKV